MFTNREYGFTDLLFLFNLLTGAELHSTQSLTLPKDIQILLN